MKRSRAFIALLSAVVVVIIAAPGVGAQSEPPPATRTMMPAPPTRSMRVRLAYHAFIRSAPARSRGNDLGVVRKGTEVEVYGVVADPSPMLGATGTRCALQMMLARSSTAGCIARWCTLNRNRSLPSRALAQCRQRRP